VPPLPLLPTLLAARLCVSEREAPTYLLYLGLLVDREARSAAAATGFRVGNDTLSCDLTRATNQEQEREREREREREFIRSLLQ
jgi:hypothetical protein